MHVSFFSPFTYLRHASSLEPSQHHRPGSLTRANLSIAQLSEQRILLERGVWELYDQNLDMCWRGWRICFWKAYCMPYQIRCELVDEDEKMIGFDREIFGDGSWSGMWDVGSILRRKPSNLNYIDLRARLLMVDSCYAPLWLRRWAVLVSWHETLLPNWSKTLKPWSSQPLSQLEKLKILANMLDRFCSCFSAIALSAVIEMQSWLTFFEDWY